MNTYIALFKSEWRELADLIRIEADDIWEANEKAIDYLKAHSGNSFVPEDLINVLDIKSITLVK